MIRGTSGSLTRGMDMPSMSLYIQYSDLQATDSGLLLVACPLSRTVLLNRTVLGYLLTVAPCTLAILVCPISRTTQRTVLSLVTATTHWEEILCMPLMS